MSNWIVNNTKTLIASHDAVCDITEHGLDAGER